MYITWDAGRTRWGARPAKIHRADDAEKLSIALIHLTALAAGVAGNSSERASGLNPSHPHLFARVGCERSGRFFYLEGDCPLHIPEYLQVARAQQIRCCSRIGTPWFCINTEALNMDNSPIPQARLKDSAAASGCGSRPRSGRSGSSLLLQSLIEKSPPRRKRRGHGPRHPL